MPGAAVSRWQAVIMPIPDGELVGLDVAAAPEKTNPAEAGCVLFVHCRGNNPRNPILQGHGNFNVANFST